MREGAECCCSRSARAGRDRNEEQPHLTAVPGQEAAEGFGEIQAHDSAERSLTNIGMSFHRPRTRLFATVTHCGW